jgi:hypothetical protein
MFCIHQTYDTEEKIIGIINSKNEFVDFISKFINNKSNFFNKTHIIDVITPEIVKNSNKYKIGFYLLNNVNKIELIEKYEKTIGYIFSSVAYDVKILFTWKLIPYELHNNNNNLVTNEDLYALFSDEEVEEDEQEKEKENNLTITKFNISNMVKSPLICLIGKKGTGKSWIITNIIDNLNITDTFLENTLIISPKEKTSNFYSQLYKKAKIIYKFDEKVVEEYFYKRKGCIVFDDCFSSTSDWQKSNIIQQIMVNNKYYGVPVIFSMQFTLGLKPELRSNFDYVFMLADDYIANKKRMYDHYAGMFPTFNVFNKVYDVLTEDFSSMVISQRGLTKNITDKIFWFKAVDTYFYNNNNIDSDNSQDSQDSEDFENY